MTAALASTVSSDGSASLGWCDAFLGVPGEVSLVYFLVILLSVGHVISHAFANDVMALHFCIVVPALSL